MIAVAIVEQTVLAVKAYYAQCLDCGWRCHRQPHDRQSTAVRHAHTHTACDGA